MVMPKIGRDRWTKYSCGIHRRPGESASEQDVEGDGRANGKPCQTARTWIHCRAVDHKYKKESQNSFHQNSLRGGEINGELRSASNDDIALTTVFEPARLTGSRPQRRERKCQSNLRRNSDIARAVDGTADLPHRLCQHVDMPMRLYPMREE
jgi:hypothetical protein